MLVDMAAAPNSIENVRLMNNLGYIGALGNIRQDASKLYGALVQSGAKQKFPSEMKSAGDMLDQGEYDQAMPVLKKVAEQMGMSSSQSTLEQVNAGIDAAIAQIPIIKAALKGKPKKQNDDTKTDWTPYILIGGAAVLGVVLLMYGFKKKGR